MGGKTNLDRVVTYIPPELKKELEEWGEEDERSVSWLVAKLIDKALKERREQQKSAKVVNMH
ncbi:hypothetical protein NIES267_21590 [Calothrix parasitica NIES-267]|uniref:CopG-like ribbon-helix-helix domain-containing protein n=1 Tax=Calothrix parasitica NIES-267 TaxID=1973488 RepID=A0A1Z4LN48_9CYAN|nr:hypothetical protein NIES267_21590 [Calothrix parasitica NIES-267]